MKIEGQLYSGLHASSVNCTMTITGQHVQFTSTDSSFSSRQYHKKELILSHRIENIPRVFETPDGLRFETTDYSQVELMESDLEHLGLFYKIESNYKVILAFTILLIVSVIYTYKVVIPKYSTQIAKVTPQFIRESISKPTEKLLLYDKVDPLLTFTDEEWRRAQDAIQDLRDAVNDQNVKIYIIDMHRQPNAFILPNGNIFLTTKLVQIAANSDQILAVLLHEMGHHHHHHVMKSIIENSALSALMVLITGGLDWSNIPLAVLSNTYSRDHETQADHYSTKMLTQIGKDPELLAEIFEKIASNTGDSEKMPQFLSTHPSFESRIKTIRSQKQ